MPADWVGGPGGLLANSRSWDEVQKEYEFVGLFESFEPQITDPESSERFHYWLNQFRYLRAVGELGCSLGEFNGIHNEIESIDDSQVNSKKLAIENRLLPVRQREMAKLSEVYKYLLNSINTRGGFGNLANWEQHVWSTAFKAQDDYLLKYLGELAPVYERSCDYPGEPRLIVPTVRSVIGASENFKLEVICVNMEVNEAKLFYRAFSEKHFSWIDLEHQARAVFRAGLKIDDPGITGFEWYVEVKDNEGSEFLYPAGGALKPAGVTIW